MQHGITAPGSPAFGQGFGGTGFCSAECLANTEIAGQEGIRPAQRAQGDVAECPFADAVNVYEDLTCCGRISATVKIKLAADERRGNFFQSGNASSIQALFAKRFRHPG